MKTVAMSALILLFASVTPAFAKRAEPQVVVLDESTPAQVLELVEVLRGKVDKVSTRAVFRTFETDIDALSARLRGLSSFDALSETQRLEISNRYESLRVRVDAAEKRGNRRVCKRERATGSNLTKTYCQTQAEIDKGAESAEAANFHNLRRPFSEADSTDPRGKSLDPRL